MNESKVRVSVAGLAIELVNAVSGQVFYPGLLNSGALRKKKEHLLSPPGGAALLTAEGQRRLAAMGAEFTEAPEAGGGRDARFIIGESQLAAALSIVESGDPDLIETDVKREWDEELVRIEMPEVQTSAILEPEDLKQIRFEPIGLYRQPLPEDGVGSSSNATIGMPTRRSFYLSRVIVSPEIVSKLEKAFPVFVLLTEAEVATTNGGRRKGSMTRGGIEFKIADNMFKV